MAQNKETSFSEKVRKELRAASFTSSEKEYSICEYDFSQEDKKPVILAAVRKQLAELFLKKGSMTDPSKGYHLEFVCENEAEAETVRHLLADYDISSGMSERGTHRVVYIKDGEDVSAVLRVMGASKSLMEMENARIVREMRGDTNRRVNFDSANINRTVSASALQTEAIRYLKEKGELRNLPKPLRDVAELRLKLPEATLSELAMECQPPIGKSGMNHRLQKILAYYRTVIEEE